MESRAARRARLLGPNVPIFYRAPLHIVRAEGVWMWDADGRRYLDCYNNVPHVGHGHPRVVEAVARQSAALNTHSRYLHDGILDYAERLTATFAPQLSQMLFTCTGSEAMDVALRMAQAATGRSGLIATDNTYHGNTASVSQLSTRRPPVGGYPSHVRLVPAPDDLRPLGGTRAGQGAAFAGHLRAAIADLEAAGHGLAGFVFCPVFANEGLPEVGAGWLDAAAEAVRAAGGLMIADEVQPGFGRTGGQMWGHRLLGVAPDIAVLGKPMGNGYPVAGLVARPEVLAAFREAFGYFNTFAASPVAAAAATAVLDVMEEEGLMENAAGTGARMAAGLSALAHPAIARVTAQGLLFAVELTEADGRTPAPVLAEDVVERMKAAGVLIGRIGREMHILKLRPPMCFGPDHADRAVAALDEALAAARTDMGQPA